MCVNCHMPERTFMDVDPRRDHSLRVPRPDLSVKWGTPNACSSCHVSDRIDSIDALTRQTLGEYADWQQQAQQNDQVAIAIEETDKWCDEACDRWYGDLRKQPKHFGEAIARFRRDGDISGLLELAMQTDDSAPAIARASAFSELAGAGVSQAVNSAKAILEKPNEDPVVRAAAINVFMTSPDPAVTAKVLLPLLRDRVRLIRTEAARVLVLSGTYASLSGAQQASVDNSLDEVKASMMLADDRAGAHMAWAMLCESRGRYSDAIESYQTAMRVEPTTTGPRTNLAAILEQLAGQRPQAERAVIMARVEMLREQELPLLGRDADLAPDNAPVQYRYGLALYLAGKLDQAMERLERAVELEPDIPTFRQARDLLKEKLNE